MKHRTFLALIISTLFIVAGCASTTPLIKASKEGDSLTVQKLIDAGANVNELDSSGYTPVMYAVWSGKTETVKVLINKGADVSAKDKSGYTPLLWASSYGYLDIAKLLIDRGADVNARGYDGSTPYSLALQANNAELSELLKNKGADITKGTDVDVKNDVDSTVLLSAVEANNIEMVKNLVESNKINLEVKDAQGMTALAYAAYNTYSAKYYSQIKIIKILIKAGADINAKTAEGETVIDRALALCLGDIIDEIIRSGINILKPGAGKARLFFVGEELWDYNSVYVGNQSKVLNHNKYIGLAFIDVEPGKHAISVAEKSPKTTPIFSIDTVAGQTYYLQVTQDMKRRIAHYAMVKLSNIEIKRLDESEAKQKIREILKSKELQ